MPRKTTKKRPATKSIWISDSLPFQTCPKITIGVHDSAADAIKERYGLRGAMDAVRLSINNEAERLKAGKSFYRKPKKQRRAKGAGAGRPKVYDDLDGVMMCRLTEAGATNLRAIAAAYDITISEAIRHSILAELASIQGGQ